MTVLILSSFSRENIYKFSPKLELPALAVPPAAAVGSQPDRHRHADAPRHQVWPRSPASVIHMQKLSLLGTFMLPPFSPAPQQAGENYSTLSSPERSISTTGSPPHKEKAYLPSVPLACQVQRNPLHSYDFGGRGGEPALIFRTLRLSAAPACKKENFPKGRAGRLPPAAHRRQPPARRRARPLPNRHEAGARQSGCSCGSVAQALFLV